MTPDELAAAKAGANKKRRLRRLWTSDCSWEEVCDEMGMDSAALREFAATLGLFDRPEPECYLPSPETIRIETEKTRASWSREERESRLVGPPRDRIEDDSGSE